MPIIIHTVDGKTATMLPENHDEADLTRVLEAGPSEWIRTDAPGREYVAVRNIVRIVIAEEREASTTRKPRVSSIKLG